MPRRFSVASWNVEHFRDTNSAARVQRVAEFVEDQGGQHGQVPEIFALYEVEGKDVYREFMARFPDHRFHMTEGAQTQEIFIGVHKDLRAFVTQRLEFKTQRDRLRPGALLSVQVGGSDYTLLFLHLKSGPDPEDFGLRDAAFIHAFNLKKALDKVQAADANAIILGDFNTMGIDDTVPWGTTLDFAAEEEIARLEDWAVKRDMKLQPKDEPHSWWNGGTTYPPSNLDHVITSEHMDIRAPGGPAGSGLAVYGWPKLAPNKVQKWLTDYSDHGLLYFEVWD